MNIIAVLNSLNTLLQRASIFCSEVLPHLAARIWNFAIKVEKGSPFIFQLSNFIAAMRAKSWVSYWLLKAAKTFS
jgi:hypothetical protein